MLIFNCSRAFADFIEPKRAAHAAPLITSPPSKRLADDAALLRDANGEPPVHLQQWLVHLVKVRRKPCVLAMEVNIRFCMLFTGLKAGEPESFINQLIERLANLQWFAAQVLGVAYDTDFDVMMNNFIAQHGTFRFFLRSERSVQAHLNEVARQFVDQVAGAGSLPQGHGECSMFDERTNRIIRRSKSHADWFYPADAMLCEWMGTYGGLTAEGVVRLQAQIDAQRKAYWAARIATVQTQLDM